jgi:hypothetical protein
VLDDQASPVPLNITYDTMAWTEVAGNRGLNASLDPHVGFASASAAGTKYSTSLNNATQATFVLVADWLPAGDTQRLAGFFRNGDTRVAYIMADGSGRVELRFRMQGGVQNSVRWPTAWQDGVRRVFHIVYDADDPTDTNRIRLYMNGVDQGAGTITQGAWPVLGVGLDFSAAVLDLAIMNEPLLTKPTHGTVYHYAVYDGELTNGQISTDAAALLADDDCGAASTFNISGTIYEDVNGDAGLGDAVARDTVTVALYQDGGDGQPDGVDDGAPTAVTTNGLGNYSFSGLLNGTYWVVVDSKTISPNAGLNGGFVQGDVWAEQTYGVAGARCDDGTGTTVELGAAGTCYGGQVSTTSDDAAALASAMSAA